MIKWFINYLENVTIALDCFLNALSGGKAKEEISLRVAKAMKEGKRWACYFCKFLHWIERNHCEKTLRGEETGDAASFRFFTLLLILFYLLIRLLTIKIS